MFDFDQAEAARRPGLRRFLPANRCTAAILFASAGGCDILVDRPGHLASPRVPAVCLVQWATAMVIIWGVRFAGKVDAVPQVGHVATRFFHLYYVPLIPVGTFLVTDERDDAFSGLPLPLSPKSILVGWLRT